MVLPSSSSGSLSCCWNVACQGWCNRLRRRLSGNHHFPGCAVAGQVAARAFPRPCPQPRRGAAHRHVHSHLPPGADGTRVGLRSLVAIGVSGGLVPCPAALVLLLGAISLGRLGFGMVLVVVFSMGLAVVLTGIGLLMVYARKVFERYTFEARIPRYLPVVSAAAISCVGLVILLGAIS